MPLKKTQPNLGSREGFVHSLTVCQLCTESYNFKKSYVVIMIHTRLYGYK